jgi:hypothetical protein
VQANFKPSAKMDHHTLVVQSAYGRPQPEGTTHHPHNTELTAQVNGVVEVDGVQYVCQGWSLAGHEPASGSGNAVNLVLTNNAVLTWHWTTYEMEAPIVAPPPTPVPSIAPDQPAPRAEAAPAPKDVPETVPAAASEAAPEPAAPVPETRSQLEPVIDLPAPVLDEAPAAAEALVPAVVEAPASRPASRLRELLKDPNAPAPKR